MSNMTPALDDGVDVCVHLCQRLRWPGCGRTGNIRGAHRMFTRDRWEHCSVSRCLQGTKHPAVGLWITLKAPSGVWFTTCDGAQQPFHLWDLVFLCSSFTLTWCTFRQLSTVQSFSQLWLALDYNASIFCCSAHCRGQYIPLHSLNLFSVHFSSKLFTLLHLNI